MKKKVQGSMPLIRLVGKIPGNQRVVVKGYFDGLVNEDCTAAELCERLDFMQETREAEVYRVAVDNGVLIVEIV